MAVRTARPSGIQGPAEAAQVELRERLREFVPSHPRLGWRKAHVVACREAPVVNGKGTWHLRRARAIDSPLSANPRATGSLTRRGAAVGAVFRRCAGAARRIRRDCLHRASSC